MALNFGLLDQGGPTNFFEGYSQGQEKMQANAMAQQRAAQAQQEFGMRQQEFAAGQAEKKRLSTAAIVTQKTASARDALLRAPTAADARRIVEMQYADPDLGPIRGRFGSLAQALAEVPEEPSAFQQYKEQEAMGMEAFLKQQGSNRAFTTAMGGAPQANAMAPASAPANAMVAPAMSGELQNFIGQRSRLAMLADQSPQVKATINRLDSDIARLVEEQKPEPGFTLGANQTRYPRGYMGVVTAPAAVAAAAVPPSVSEYQFAKTVDGGSFVGTYQEFVKAKADATRAPATVAAPQALPASVQEYEYAKTVPGGSFVGTYQDFVKAKADAARAPAPISAPQALPQSVAEYNFAKTPDGGGFVGTLTDFMQARAEATRAPTPVVAPQALPASVLEYNFAKTPEGGGFVGTYQDFVQSKAEAGRAPVPITAPPTKVAEYEYAKTPAGGNYKGTYTQFLNLGKSEVGGTTVPKAPSGYRFNKAGDLEPIPGGPAAGKPLTALQQQALKKDFAADTSKIKSAVDTADELEKLTDELVGNPDKKIKPHPGLGGITGYAGLLPSLPSGDATKAEQKLETFKGKIKTLGRSLASLDGKLGNMAVQEWKFISDAVQEIRPTAGNLDEQMRDVVRQARLLAKNLRDKFDLTYDETTPAAAPGRPAAAALAPADKQALDWANANPKDPRSLQIKQRLGQ